MIWFLLPKSSKSIPRIACNQQNPSKFINKLIMWGWIIFHYTQILLTMNHNKIIFYYQLNRIIYSTANKIG